MKIVADRARCAGLGMCEAMAHEFFEVGDDGTVVVLDDSPPPASRGEVQSAVDSCPMSALTLVD
jgi:ferredoxin